MPCGKWSDWASLEAVLNDEVPAPKRPGVYAIRYAPRGKAKAIRRAFGPDADQEGILCYGRTGCLRGRLRAFYRAALGEKAPHAEGIRFHQLKYAENGYPLRSVQVRWQVCTSKKAADKRERELLNNYADRFGEAPPLNRQVPARR